MQHELMQITHITLTLGNFVQGSKNEKENFNDDNAFRHATIWWKYGTSLTSPWSKRTSHA